MAKKKKSRKISKKQHKKIVKKPIKKFEVPIKQLIEKHSHKGFYVAFGMIILLIILFSLILYIPEEEREPIKITPTTPVKTENQTIPVIKPIISKSVFDENLLINEMADCIRNEKGILDKTTEVHQAINSNDINACSALEEDEKDFCQAKINKDTAYCNEAPNKDVCRAIILNNKNLCKDDKNCIMFILKDISVCNIMDLKPSLICKFQLSNDKKYYDLVIQEISKDCTDQVYNRFALIYKEPDLCLRIINKEIKQKCQSTTSIDS